MSLLGLSLHVRFVHVTLSLLDELVETGSWERARTRSKQQVECESDRGDGQPAPGGDDRGGGRRIPRTEVNPTSMRFMP